jgi:DNA-binding MarR family transcriptional regulator
VLLIRARLISKAVTAIYDESLRPFGVSATQFALLTAIRGAPITRAEIARLHHLHKSTLTRDLKSVLSEGWIQEVREGANGRSRPIALTQAGKELMLNAERAWLAAQDQTEKLLGTDGMANLMSVTERLLQRPAVFA